jgi:hypothetical protein
MPMEVPKVKSDITIAQARQYAEELKAKGRIWFDKPLADNALRADCMREHRKTK